jgi:hypothetical protein
MEVEKWLKLSVLLAEIQDFMDECYFSEKEVEFLDYLNFMVKKQQKVIKGFIDEKAVE